MTPFESIFFGGGGAQQTPDSIGWPYLSKPDTPTSREDPWLKMNREGAILDQLVLWRTPSRSFLISTNQKQLQDIPWVGDSQALFFHPTAWNKASKSNIHFQPLKKKTPNPNPNPKSPTSVSSINSKLGGHDRDAEKHLKDPCQKMNREWAVFG